MISLYAGVAQRPQPAGGGEGLIRNQLGRAEAQPSSELNATEVGMECIQEATRMCFQNWLAQDKSSQGY